MATSAAERTQMLAAGSCFCFCSVGMMLFNKLAVEAFPLECSLVAVQMIFSSLALLTTWSSLHIGSMKDLLRWCMVVPFFCSMLLTSILALKHAPMSLVIVMRSMSPLGALAVERFYPEPSRISAAVVGSILMMVAGGGMYVSQIRLETNALGIFWVAVNSVVAVGDRCVQRLLLAKDEQPVDISKTAVTLINNSLGAIPLLIAAYATGECQKLHTAVAALGFMDKFYILLSCVIGLGISYSGIWAQSLISATSFLVMVNANK
eukprot:gb/GFBE01047929.1/.p1 GENE.gb/GFBE01047929.1/~~gb/GFBE01047929.1/.p1  ORF type:complete len:263 (+),score=66.57 gb/GFBE01047929.1/:1-789(+)